jgi:hypothetical protein
MAAGGTSEPGSTTGIKKTHGNGNRITIGFSLLLLIVAMNVGWSKSRCACLHKEGRGQR